MATLADNHVCPFWLGYFLVNPLRKLMENPFGNLRGLVNHGMTVLDAGCAMGFYSLPMAELVGPEGRVLCVDLQERMVQKLLRRARKKELHMRIEARVCTPDDLNVKDLSGTVDFALASAVLHETPDQSAFLAQLREVLVEGGRLLVLEPAGHVSRRAFGLTLDAADENGLRLQERGRRGYRRTALFVKDRA